jgi:hypothetical protein
VDAVRYTGPVTSLQGETALALPGPTPDLLKVQFDKISTGLAYGWTAMPAAHFQLVPVTQLSEVPHG